MRKYGCIIIVLFIFVTTALTMRMTCKMLRISLSGRDGYLAHWYTRETVEDKTYEVKNSYYCPEYYEYKDWGFFLLSVVDDNGIDGVPYSISSNEPQKRVTNLSINRKTVPCKWEWEKNLAAVCYNDELGNVYKTTIPENDPRVAVLLYKSKNKNRKKLVELWLQLNKEKEGHELIFDVNNPEKSAEKYKSEYF